MMKRETADDMLVVVGGAAAAANVSGGSGGVNDADATFTRQLCVYCIVIYQNTWIFPSFYSFPLSFYLYLIIKTDHSIEGELQSVDQFLNIKLLNISVVEPEKYPHMMSVKNCFIRG